MGTVCNSDRTTDPLTQINSLSLRIPPVSSIPKEDPEKRILKERVEVNVFPILNKHVEERIKKLTKIHQNPKRIWKLKSPYNMIYANNDPQISDGLPKGYVQVYKLKENGEFQGYFQGNIDQDFQVQLKDSIFVYPNASYFVGSSSNEGTYTNEVTSLSYKGGWSNEQPHGEGVEKNNKGKYTGGYNLGEKEGKGRFEWADGSTFEGQFLKGLFHGTGKIEDTDNKYSYQGQFSSGQKHGKGFEKYEFQTYEGEFYKGKRCGNGILTIFNPDNGNIKLKYEGNFCKGVPSGKGRITKASQKPVSGIWEDGHLIAIAQ